MHISSLYYNSNGIEETNNDDIFPRRGFTLWVDIIDPKPHELDFIQDKYNIDKDTLKVIEHQSKRPQVRILDDYTFTIILHMHYKTLKQLLVSGIYIYSGKDWLITIHSSEVDLINPIKFIFEQKNKKLLESGVDALYFTILGEIISKYEQLLTSIELTITEFEQMALYKKVSKSMLSYLSLITKQIILLRRHFWYTRDVLNFLTHVQKDKQEVRYLQIVYDDISQLIELIESYRDTINSTRDLYIANVSLQLSDTMRILTIFSSVLLPLTLIAGIYGMNGLDLTQINEIPQGLLVVLLTMLGIVILLLLFFKQKQWIFSKEIKIEELDDF